MSRKTKLAKQAHRQLRMRGLTDDAYIEVPRNQRVVRDNEVVEYTYLSDGRVVIEHKGSDWNQGVSRYDKESRNG